MGIAKSKVEAATFHSIGYRAWRNFSHIQRGPDSDKCATLLSGLVEGDRKFLRTLKLVKRKNVRAIEIVFEYLLGKPTQRHEIDATVALPDAVAILSRVYKTEESKITPDDDK